MQPKAMFLFEVTRHDIKKKSFDIDKKIRKRIEIKRFFFQQGSHIQFS